jgi:hypothetical protein
MAAAWSGPVAWRCPADTPGDLRVRGRQCAGVLAEQLRTGRLPQGYRHFDFADGVTVDVTFNGPGLPPIIAIAAPEPAPTRVTVLQRPPLWVPRGFVVYPAGDDAPCGWGLPLLQVGDDRYAPENLRPGLDVGRWTAGGALGQVLLTRVPDAGYPSARTDRVTSPLLFNATHGPRPAGEPVEGLLPVSLPPDPATQPYTGYRIEFEPYRAQLPDGSPEEVALVGAIKRALAERIAAFRAGVGALTLPVRGYYDSAQATVQQVIDAQVLGHYSAAFDPTYRTQDDRTTRDGVSVFVATDDSDDRNTRSNAGEALTALTTNPPTQIGTDPNGRPILDISGGGPPITADAAADAFEADAVDAAMLADTRWDTGLGRSSALLLGVRDNVACAQVVERDQWVACGNVAWHSNDPTVPSLSWFGSYGLNEMADVTFPVTLVPMPPQAGDPDEWRAQLAAWQPYTVDRTSLRDEDGYFWWRYVVSDADTPPEQWHVQPLMDSRIFCRGRAIAIAPRGGFVWAAAIQAREEGGHRLVALVHQDDDQPTDGTTVRSNGLTPYLRVWRCDIPNLSQLLANPEVVVRGVRGEATEWPWDDANDPYAWTGGEIVDVGTSDGSTRDLLSYASQWQFSPDGRSAICLRLWGEYPYAYRTDQTTYEQQAAAFSHNDFEQGLIFGHKPRPGALRLNIDGAGSDLTWLGFNAEGEPEYNPVTELPVPRAHVELPQTGIFSDVIDGGIGNAAYPDLVAAGWSDAGTPAYALIGATRGFVVDWDIRFNGHVYFVSWLDSLAETVDAWQTRAIAYGQVAVKPGQETLGVTASNRGVLVLDVARKALVSLGTVPRFTRQIAGGNICVPNDGFSPCWADDPPEQWFAVNVWVDGQRVHGKWHPNPDRIVINQLYLCFEEAINGDPRRQMPLRRLLQASWAKRGDDWMVAYTLIPQLLAEAVTSVSGNCPTYENPTLGIVYQTACTPRPGDVTFLDFGDFRCAGAGAVSSFAAEAALLSATGAGGGNSRLLYARTV